MNERWTFYLLVFGAVFLGIQGLRGLFLARREAKRANARFATIDHFAKNREEVELLKKRSSFAGQEGVLGRLHGLYIQSGSKLGMTKLLIIYVALFGLAFLVTWKFQIPLGIVISVILPAVLLLLFLMWKRSRRIEKFGEQLPDVIDIVVRSLKAGHPLPVAVSLVGREMPAPAGPEFMVVFEEISYGRELRDAMEGLQRRVGHPDLQFLLTSIAIAHQTGGNLGEILARLSKLIRERFRMKRKIRALSAEGRAGGMVLSIVPFVIFGAVAVLNPKYYAEFWGHPTQNFMIGVAVVFLTIGNIVIYKLVNFKV